MLYNLLRNCIDHNPGGCRIEVTAAPAPGGGCLFTVADDGAGVSEGQLQALNRGGPVASTQPGGPDSPEHGLGLRIVRQIVEAHRGRLTFAAGAPHGLVVQVQVGP